MRHWAWLWFPALLAAGAAQGGTIVDTDFVAAAQQRGALIWDTRSAAEYRREHIPGAVSIGDVGTALRDDNSEDYLPLPQLEKVLGAAGIDPAREVVVYGAKGNAYPYFALLTLQHFGAQKAFVFHGGIEDWKAAGRPVSTEPAVPVPVALKLTPVNGVTLSTQEVIERVNRRGAQIVDARTPKEYSGDDIRAIRGGHLPGAVNIPYEQNWQDPEAQKRIAARQPGASAGLALKPREQLKALYAALDPEKETVVYCQSGVRAAETATVLRELGFKDVKVYDSSWLGYAARLDAPAEDVKFFNFGALRGQLAGMQRRIDQLERQLAEAQAQLAGGAGQKPACVNC